MTTKKQLVFPMLLISVGLLLVVLPILIKAFIKVPDFLRGMLMGIGLVMEITAVVILKKKSDAASKSTEAGSYNKRFK
jgi:hypothetical protein